LICEGANQGRFVLVCCLHHITKALCEVLTSIYATLFRFIFYSYFVENQLNKDIIFF
jgi:hypothetical protein